MWHGEFIFGTLGNANDGLSEKPLDYILYCDVFEPKLLGKQINYNLYS